MFVLNICQPRKLLPYIKFYSFTDFTQETDEKLFSSEFLIHRPQQTPLKRTFVSSKRKSLKIVYSDEDDTTSDDDDDVASIKSHHSISDTFSFSKNVNIAEDTSKEEYKSDTESNGEFEASLDSPTDIVDEQPPVAKHLITSEEQSKNLSQGKCQFESKT